MSNDPRRSLDGKVALVTGGGRGIGRAICLALAREGAKVAIASRDEAANGAVAKEAAAQDTEALGVACDVTNEESVHRTVQAVTSRFRRIDLLVNNAGFVESEPILRTDKDNWERTLAVNLTGTYLCTRAVLEGMLKRGRGQILCIASTAGKVGYPYVSAYCAAKHGVVGFVRAVAQEIATRGVTINAICPGFVDSDLTNRSVRRIMERTGVGEDGAREVLEGMSPQRRLIGQEEVAELVVRLAADGIPGIHGQAINLDGGGVSS